MRAIVIDKESIGAIKGDYSRQLVRQMKALARTSVAKQEAVFFIPEYNFPEAADIPRENFITEAELYQRFHVGAHIADTRWISIRPKSSYTRIQSLEE